MCVMFVSLPATPVKLNLCSATFSRTSLERLRRDFVTLFELRLVGDDDAFFDLVCLIWLQFSKRLPTRSTQSCSHLSASTRRVLRQMAQLVLQAQSYEPASNYICTYSAVANGMPQLTAETVAQMHWSVAQGSVRPSNIQS